MKRSKRRGPCRQSSSLFRFGTPTITENITNQIREVETGGSITRSKVSCLVQVQNRRLFDTSFCSSHLTRVPVSAYTAGSARAQLFSPSFT